MKNAYGWYVNSILQTSWKKNLYNYFEGKKNWKWTCITQKIVWFIIETSKPKIAFKVEIYTWHIRNQAITLAEILKDRTASYSYTISHSV